MVKPEEIRQLGVVWHHRESEEWFYGSW